MSNTITVFKGDGIGPEITDAVLKIADARGMKQKTNQKVWKKE